MAKEKLIYHCSGLRDGWPVCGMVKATSKTEARKKFRARYKRLVTHITVFSCWATD